MLSSGHSALLLKAVVSHTICGAGQNLPGNGTTGWDIYLQHNLRNLDRVGRGAAVSNTGPGERLGSG